MQKLLKENNLIRLKMEKEELETEIVEDNNEITSSEQEAQREEKEQDKKIVKNVFLVALSNIFTLLAGVLVGFVIQRIRGFEYYYCCLSCV